MAFSFNFRASETQQITCYHCGAVQEVGRRALTVTCRACNKPLQIGDLKVKNYDARRKVQTTGSLVVEKKGQIVSDAVECGTAVVRGTIKTKHGTVVRGTALVGPGAQVVGDFKCQRLAVGAGASLDGFYVVGRDEMTPPPPPTFDGEEVGRDAAE